MKIAHTKDTLSEIYLDALQIRNQVFMIEQGVPRELEIDKHEAECIHFVYYSADNQAIATCRLLPLNSSKIKLQRMAVQQNFRGQDYGRRIIEAAEVFCREQNYSVIVLDAQLPAIGFYEKLGYVSSGEIFLDAEIAHKKMTKKIENSL